MKRGCSGGIGGVRGAEQRPPVRVNGKVAGERAHSSYFEPRLLLPLRDGIFEPSENEPAPDHCSRIDPLDEFVAIAALDATPWRR